MHTHMHCLCDDLRPFEKLDLAPLDAFIDLSSTRITYSEKHNAAMAMVIHNNTVITALTRTSTLFCLCSHFVFL